MCLWFASEVRNMACQMDDEWWDFNSRVSPRKPKHSHATPLCITNQPAELSTTHVYKTKQNREDMLHKFYVTALIGYFIACQNYFTRLNLLGSFICRTVRELLGCGTGLYKRR
jgi:hypothetical protein